MYPLTITTIIRINGGAADAYIAIFADFSHALSPQLDSNLPI